MTVASSNNEVPAVLSLDFGYGDVIRVDVTRDVQRLLSEGVGYKWAATFVTSWARPRPRSLLELDGLGAEIWRSVDPAPYVDRLRDEWNAR